MKNTTCVTECNDIWIAQHSAYHGTRPNDLMTSSSAMLWY